MVNGGSLKRRLDFGGEEAEVELVGLFSLKWVKARSFPPGAGAGAQRSYDHGAAGRLLVELDAGGSRTVQLPTTHQLSQQVDR